MQVDACKKLEETMHVHGKHHSRDSTFDLLLINFFQKFFWQNLSCQTRGAAYNVSASAAYTPVFTVFHDILFFWL